jgi:endonuclease/exonuclease/phosphatase family metal-dependent hydrolase
VARHPGIVVRVVTWNLFHGRDHPPDPALRTWRSRLLRITERYATHAQVNRPLRAEFAAVLAGLPWHVALLQEVPPRWLRPLSEAAGASGVSALTSRNLLHMARAALAWINPDLVASNEGGSNQVLVRPPWRIVRVTRETIARRPERRRMLLARLRHPDGPELVVANLHASTGDPADEVIAAADRAVAWSAGAPLLFGGDLNLRPAQAADAFAELERGYGLVRPTAPDAIDHLLSRGLVVVEPPAPLPPPSREVRDADGRAIRLSDHSPVAATLEVE